MKLYIAEYCEPCHEVVDFIKKHSLSVEIINVKLKKNDFQVGEKLPKDVLLIPLFVNGKIRIRGTDDIIKYLKRMRKVG